MGVYFRARDSKRKSVLRHNLRSRPARAEATFADTREAPTLESLFQSSRETLMHRKLIILSAAVQIFIAGAIVATRLETVHGQGQPGAGFAAVPGSKGGWDLTGPYEVVRDWPKPMAQLPGHENWGWGAVEGVFAESPNRVF